MCGSLLRVSGRIGYLTLLAPFSSAGAPTGSCGAFVASPTCFSTKSVAVVTQACLGAATCGVRASTSAFSPVTCPVQPSSLSVQVTCSVPTAWGAVTPAGSTPPARAYASLVSSPDGKLAYLFGGQTAAGTSGDLYMLSSSSGFADASPSVGEMVNLAASPHAVAFQSSTNLGGFAWMALSPLANPAYTNSLVRIERFQRVQS